MATDAAGLRGAGNEAFQRGDIAAAVALYTRAIAADPKDDKAWTNRALMYLKLKEPVLAWGDAMHVYERLTPTNPKALTRLGTASQALRLYDHALSAYGVCLRLPLDAATRKDIEARIAVCEADKERRLAEAAKSPVVSDGAHKDAVTPEVTRRMLNDLLVSGVAQVTGSYRSGVGGPRHPAAIGAAFAVTTDAVVLKEAKGGGMGVHAARDLARGVTVHIETPLLAAALEGPACYHCLRPLGALRAVACRGATCDRQYCSADCERDGFLAYHGPLCGAAGGKAVAMLEARASAGVSASSRFILLMWKMLGRALVAAKAAAGAPLLPPTDAPPLCHLARISDRKTPDAAEEGPYMTAAYFIRTWGLLRDAAGPDISADPALSIAWVRDAVAMLGPNVLGLHRPGGASVVTCGQALMGAGSFFNHSCVPNTTEISNMDTSGSTVRFITNRAIRKGEELCIAYCDTDVPFQNRCDTLRAQYGFECTCPKCVTEAP